MVNVVIRAGAPVNTRDTEGNSIIIQALETLRRTKALFITKAVDDFVDDKIQKEHMINGRNNRGETPILTLIYNEPYEIEDKVKLLIKHGADVRIPDNRGTTSLLW